VSQQPSRASERTEPLLENETPVTGRIVLIRNGELVAPGDGRPARRARRGQLLPSARRVTALYEREEAGSALR